MLRRVLIRTGVGLLTLWAVSLLVFLGTQLLPGDAAQAALGQQATPQLVAGLRKQFGLDRPVLVRYGEWLGGFLHGDLGRSLPTGDPVAGVLGDHIRNTAVLAGLTLALLIPLSVVLGVIAAVRRDRPLDHTLTGVTLTLISTPEFVVGTLLAYLIAIRLNWLPPVSLVDASQPVLAQLNYFVLPVLTLLAASLAQTIRMVRASMIDVLESDYVTMARLKGVPERQVLFGHALPNAAGPLIQVLAFNVAWLIGGIVVTERVFQFPGVGLALASAVTTRDQPTVEAVAMLATGIYIAANLLADLSVIVLNPRLRRGP